ncbi:hypothetical protein CQ010_06935 [Arthrobacter sp. MYb211]|uniref:DUF1206 domain-containing protein n=1 Tax=unclassified Arthrobacter TaxID=235627 RepID=UPI000CFCC98C|nr:MULTISPECIES: DUF1206 domain-containing protein [unclassified Arthrobacter]PRA11825.1 hypothetical protein CQ015_07630 [Arthrobacter sp. MYb221]PRC08182.1 hypothetical protein CQ010_06935 [Arthrobacter sp. MYb211]
MKGSADAVHAARMAADHPWFERAARLGYAANGLLHGALGLLAVLLATGGSAEADQSGALQALAAQPFGEVLLWVCAAGASLLGFWHLGQAFFEQEKLFGRLKYVATGLVFIVVGATFGRYALGGRSDSGQTASSFSAELMGHPLGRIALILLGLALIAMAGYYAYKGVTRRFLADLSASGGTKFSPAIKLSGTIGYVAKALVLAALGLLFISSTIQQDPDEATGVDGALKAIGEQSFGPPVLAAIGVGLLAYALYLFFRARFDSMD